MPSTVTSTLFWVAAVCCVVAQLAVVWSAVRSPIRPADEPGVPTPRRPIEIAWTIVPAIALAFLLVSTWKAMHRPKPMDHNMPGMTHKIEE